MIKQVTEGRIVKKKPVRRPRTRWKDVVGKDLKMIHENVKMEDANDKIRWNEIMVAAIDLHGPLSCWEEEVCILYITFKSLDQSMGT
jgi:hypothetical protein